MSGAAPAILGRNAGPWDGIRRCLVLVPRPDDFEVVTLTLRHLEQWDVELFLEVLTGGAGGVEDCFAAT